MSKIHDIIALISGFRKLFLTCLGIGLVTFLSFTAIGIFIVGWRLETLVITGDNLTVILTQAFKSTAAIVGVYCGSNVCVKGIQAWIAKKRK